MLFIRKMYTKAYLVELVTYKKYFVNRKYIASDGSSYIKPQPFIGFYIDDESISRVPYNIIFKEVDTGHLVWVHINNEFYEICLPYLDQIRNYGKSVPSLQHICKSIISTRDLYLFEKYYC